MLLSSGEDSFLLKISSSHFNTNLLINGFSQEQFLASKYSSNLHALLHSQSSFSQELQSSNSLHSD